MISISHIIRNNEALALTPQTLTIRNFTDREQTVIAWKEIEGISESYIGGEHYITLHLHNPYCRINRKKNSFYRILMRLNMHFSGSPYHIVTGALRCDPDELFGTLLEYLKTYGHPMSPE